MPSPQMQHLNELKAAYEEARSELQATRDSMSMDPPQATLDELDAAKERFTDTEVAYHDGLYGAGPGMGGDDRTAAALQLKEMHGARWEQGRDRARAEERAGRERIDDLSQDFTVESVESYQSAQDKLREYDGPEAGGWDWSQDRGEWGR